jgi:hypothetical protein
MSALRSVSHLSRVENDNVTIHSESGAAQAIGFPCDTHSGLQDPGGTNRYQPESAIAAAWRRFNVPSVSHRQVSQRLPVCASPESSFALAFNDVDSKGTLGVTVGFVGSAVGSVLLPKPIPPAQEPKDNEFRINPDPEVSANRSPFAQLALGRMCAVFAVVARLFEVAPRA